MPRAADQGLEERVLKAAQRLWRARGDKGLTLRAVAREAGTTTTTVYKRFRNREALLLALAERVRLRATTRITSASTVQELCSLYLHFAETHPHEYRLFWGPTWPQLLGPGRPRPVQTWFLSKLSAEYGGRPEDYAILYNALFLLLHGTATLLAASRNRISNARMKENCLALCDRLVENIQIFLESSGSRNADPRSVPASGPTLSKIASRRSRHA